MKLGLGTRSPIGTVISLIIIGACGFGSGGGCRNYDLVWSAEHAPRMEIGSPPLERRRAEGFGNAFDTMSVYLKGIKSSDHSVEIFESRSVFDGPVRRVRPYDEVGNSIAP